jgi:rfaE bifunctional protein kinase chain/domain
MTSHPTTDRLLELVHSMDGLPVVVLADLVADRFVTGTPKRISREAPVLILSFEAETLTPGGGANAVNNVRALDGRPLALGAVGDDRNGDELLERLTAGGIDTTTILRREGYLTPTKTRILGGGGHAIKQQIVRYDIEDRLELTDEERHRLAQPLLDGRAEGARVAILSDYGYGTVEPELLPAIRRALGEGATVVCDSRYRLGDFAGLDGATPNEEEAEALLGDTLPEDGEALWNAGSRLRAQLGARFLLITRGSRGMVLFEEETMSALPVHGTDQVADVTGAGDTVIGTFALALAAGATPFEATMLANYAAGVVVMKMGTATLGRDELEHAVRSDPLTGRISRWAKS